MLQPGRWSLLVLVLLLVLFLVPLWGCEASRKVAEDAETPDSTAQDAAVDRAIDLVMDVGSIADAPPPDAGDANRWALAAGGAALDKGYALAVDGKGNIYVTGYFRTQASFGGQTLSSKGWSDLFLIKLDSTGKVLWARSGGGSGEDQGQDVAVDPQGNVILVASFTGPASFGKKTLQGSGLVDVAVVKVAPDGSVLWAVEAGGPASDEPHGVALGKQGDLYITGSFQQTATFGQEVLTSAGSYDGFIAKLSSAGGHLWSRSVGGKGVEIAHGVAVDGSGNAYIAGSFHWTADFGGTTLSTAGNTHADIFVHKLDSAGSGEWAVSAGGNKFDAADDIAVDASGNLFITGNFWDVAQFGTLTLTSVGGSDLYAASLDANGTFIWATPAGGPNGFIAQGIAVDASGGAYVTGFFQGQAQFGSQGFVSKGQNDVFVARFSPVGSRVSAVTAGGPDDDRAFDIAIDATGYAHVTGWFRGTSHDYGPHTISSSGFDDCFVWKLLCP